MSPGRISEVDLPGPLASQALTANLNGAKPVELLAEYHPVCLRKRIRWEGINRNRGLLFGLFRASRGHLLHQKSFHAQVLEFLNSFQAASTEVQAEQLSYRIRCMMSHLS